MSLKDLYTYFSGHTVVQGASEWETVAIPKAERDVVNAAIRAAVKDKQLWLLSGQASMLAEEVPPDLLTDEATLQKPPMPLAVKETMPDNLPEAWQGKTEITALEIANALSTKAGKPLPWALVREVLTNAFNSRFLERTHGQWPCDYAGAHMVGVGQRTEVGKQPPTGEGERGGGKTTGTPPIVHHPEPPYGPSGVFTVTATLRADEIQNLVEELKNINDECLKEAGTIPTFQLHIELRPKLSTTPNLEKINELLQDVSPQLKLT